MFANILFKLLALLAFAAYLLPTALGAGTLLDSCDYTNFNNMVLTFCCDTDQHRYEAGKPRFWQHRQRIDLNHFIGNDNGQLVWWDNGKFADSCDDCTIPDGWPKQMECRCWTNNFMGTKRSATDPWLLHLNDRLVNVNGTLVCPDHPELGPEPNDGLDDIVGCFFD